MKKTKEAAQYMTRSTQTRYSGFDRPGIVDFGGLGGRGNTIVFEEYQTPQTLPLQEGSALWRPTCFCDASSQPRQQRRPKLRGVSSRLSLPSSRAIRHQAMSAIPTDNHFLPGVCVQENKSLLVCVLPFCALGVGVASVAPRLSGNDKLARSHPKVKNLLVHPEPAK